ncbi:MAG: gliding motility-associated C-terminal domain-containing protein [Bacteroidales bacterium]|nr:gliding motility-associated C-terminal domain-containing protein [Bacteroidales bacterium]
MKRFLYMFIIVQIIVEASGSQCFGQESFEIALGGSLEERPFSVVSLEDGSFTVVGTTKSSGAGNSDVILFNVDNQAEVQWSKTYGNSMRDPVRILTRCADNGYLITAWNTTTSIVDDWHLIRTDDKGNVLWDKYVGEDLDDEVEGTVRVGDEYYFSGSTHNYGIGRASVFFAKMDDQGNFLWFKTFSAINNDHGKGIIFTNNTLVLAGYSASFGNGTNDFILIKTDLDGNAIWSYHYPTAKMDYSFRLVETSDLGYLIVGFSNSFGAGDNDIYVLKTDRDGIVQWAKTYGGIADDRAYDIKKLSSGNLVISGATQSFGAGGIDVFVMEVDQAGNLIWAKVYGGEENDDRAYVDVYSDGSLVVAASTESYGNGGKDFFLIKTDQAGNSCCSNSVDDLQIRNVSVTEDTISFVVENGAVSPVRSMTIKDPELEQELLCTDELKIIGDTVFCGDASNVPYFVDPAVEGDYTWTIPEDATIVSGQGTPEIIVDFGNISGFITVSLNGGCSNGALDSLYVSLSGSMDIDLGPDTSFCYGHTVLLSPGGGYYAYYWQDGSTDSVYLAGLTGYYWVQVTDSAGCTAIDSVYIEAFLDFGFSIGPDTSVICDGDYLFLHGPEGYENYLWQDGSGYPDFVADTAGIYWLEITDENGCAARDSMLLIVNKIPDDFLGNDTVMCEDDYFPIHAPPYYDKYLWQDGSTGSVFIAWETGSYWVYVEDSIGCSGTDTLKLSLFEAPSLNQPDTVICPNSSILLSPGPGWDYYKWSTGSTDPAILVNKEGIYWVETGTPCGPFTDSVFIDFYTNPAFALGPDTNICENETIKLTPGPGFLSYLWNDGTTDSVLIAEAEGNYWLTVNDGRCLLGDTILVDKCSLLWIPNVFTPNGDGVNDTFYAVGKGVTEFNLVIFNRWGEVMKTLHSIEESWDGTYHGRQCSDGVYYYVATFRESDRNAVAVTKQINGAVTLIR